MAAPVMGLAPTSPLIAPPPVDVTAAPASTVKRAAVPRLTGAGPAPAWVGATEKSETARVTPTQMHFERIHIGASDRGEAPVDASVLLGFLIIISGSFPLRLTGKPH